MLNKCVYYIIKVNGFFEKEFMFGYVFETPSTT